MIELVDFNEIYGKHISCCTAESAEPAKKTRRAGSRKKAEKTEATTAETPATTAEATKEETSAE